MKLLVFIAICAFVTPVFAQRINLDSARIYLAQDNYTKAMPFANEAAKNAKTKDDPEAWFLRGMVYLSLTMDETAKSPNSITEAYGYFLKTLTLKPDYGMEINKPLYSVAIIKFNRGSAFFAEKSFERAYNEFAEIYAIYKMDGGKRFKDNKEFKAVEIDARKNAAYSANNSGRSKVAATLLEDLIKEGITDDTHVYETLIDIYDAGKNTTEELAVINGARKQFPDNQTFRIMEINYYIGNGIREGLQAKLEEALKLEPENTDLLFHLGELCIETAFPADAQGKLLAQPANFEQLYATAENSYTRALKISPDAAAQYYDFGMLYYNHSRWFGQQVDDNPTAGDKAVSEWTAKSSEELAKALPHFEKAFSLMDAKANLLTDSEKPVYQNTMIALRQIYTRNGDAAKKEKMDKAIEKMK